MTFASLGGAQRPEAAVRDLRAGGLRARKEPVFVTAKKSLVCEKKCSAGLTQRSRN